MDDNSPIDFVDIEPEDGAVAEAMRCALRLLDSEIEGCLKCPAQCSESRLRALLTVRFGHLVGRSLVIEGPCAEPRRALAAALLSTEAKRQSLASGTVVLIPPQIDYVTAWLRRKLDDAWPTEGVGSRFLAEDVVTIWTALSALGLAEQVYPAGYSKFPAPPTLIVGPTGTGKELLARAIFARSPTNVRRRGFVAVNCGGVESTLLDSELFGHVAGAFTDAKKSKRGLLEQYGVVLLDEIGDAPPATQVKLLRFLNSGEMRRVGAVELTKLEHGPPRIIAATHVDLESKVRSGGFREDLLHRLRARTLTLQSIAERSTSVHKLFESVIEEVLSRQAAVAAQDRRPPSLSAEVIGAVSVHPWQGNMREMRYAAERVLETAGSVVELSDLPAEIQKTYRSAPLQGLQDALAIVRRTMSEPHDKARTKMHAEFLVRRRFDEHCSNPLAQHRKYGLVADAIRLFGERFGLGNRLDAVEGALRALEVEESVTTFQEQWSGARRLLRGWSLEAQLDEFLSHMDAELTSLAQEARRKRGAHVQDMRRNSRLDAVLALTQRLAPLLASFPLEGVKIVLEYFTDIVESDEITALVSDVVKTIGDLPPEAAIRRLGHWLAETDVSTLILDAPAESEPLTVKTVRGNPDLLVKVMAEEPTDELAAGRLERTPKTLQRWLAEAEKTQGMEKGQLRREIRKLRAARFRTRLPQNAKRAP